MPFVRLVAATLALLLLVANSGCGGFAPARRKVTGDIVKNVHFEGNGGLLSGHNDYTLRLQIETEQSPFGTLTFPLTYLIEPSVLDGEDLWQDGYRLEVWYAHNGWFDARFEGWEVQRKRPRTKRRAGVVDVTGVVMPGPRSRVRELRIEGLAPGTATYGRSAEREGEIHRGDPFDLALLLGTRDILLQKLREEAARAYATAEIAMDAYPEDQAVEVTILAVPGILSRIGPITVVGNDVVDEAVIRDELALETGERYSLEELREAQRRLFDLGVFSFVTVTPDLSDPTRADVPIEVKVTETLFRSIRLGGGVDYDGFVLTPRLATTFRHVNLFQQLLRLETRAEVGYSQRFGAGGLVASGDPVYLGKVTLSHPRIFNSRKYGVLLDGEIERDLQSGQFPYFNPKIDLAFTWQPSERWLFKIGPHWEQFEFTSLEEGPTLLVARLLFGEAFRNPYRLTTLDANFTFDGRDDPLFTRRGTYGVLGLRQAFPLTDRDYFYTDVNIDGRVYLGLRLPRAFERPEDEPLAGMMAKAGRGGRIAVRTVVPEVLALRLKGQLVQSWDGRAIPYPERAFLGGSSDLRGFRDDQVGPYDVLCLYDPTGFGDPFTGEPGAGTDAERFYLPEGGTLSLAVGSEARYDITSSITGVAFVDAGLLTNGLSEVSFDDLRVGTGVGARYATAVGPIRVDLGLRPLYPPDWGPDEYLNCKGADRVPRSFDLLSLPVGSRDLADRAVPFAINMYFAIGEAF